MHVGLNAVFWQPDSGGPGTYARELLRALPAAAPGLGLTVWVGRDAPEGLEEEFGGAEVRWVRLPLRSAGSPVHVVHELAVLGLDARRRGVDVVHGLAYASPLLAPGVATVVTVHDLIWRDDPTSTTALARRMFALLLATSGRMADRVVVHTAAVRDQLVTEVGFDPARIDVAPAGARGRAAAPTPESVLRQRLALPAGADVVLCVGQVAGHKNLGAALHALADLPGAHLVVAGRPRVHAGRLVELAEHLGVADRVAWLGWATEADLEGLFTLAACVLVPSRHEGFGLAVVEAMARGVPVACADIPVLREVAGEAAVRFDPERPAALAAAVRMALRDRERLAAAGREHARRWSWSRTAAATLASYRRALHGRGRAAAAGAPAAARPA